MFLAKKKHKTALLQDKRTGTAAGAGLVENSMDWGAFFVASVVDIHSGSTKLRIRDGY